LICHQQFAAGFCKVEKAFEFGYFYEYNGLPEMLRSASYC